MSLNGLYSPRHTLPVDRLKNLKKVKKKKKGHFPASAQNQKPGNLFFDVNTASKSKPPSPKTNAQNNANHLLINTKAAKIRPVFFYLLIKPL